MVRAILTPIVWTVNVWMNGYAGVQWVFMSLVLLWGKNRLGDQVGVNR